MAKVDFQIIGQGIAGTLLGLALLERGYRIKIFDPNHPDTSSRKAAGIYNPITGRKMVKTWMADDLFLSLEDFYSALEKKIGAVFLHTMPIYRPFHSFEEQNDWMVKKDSAEYSAFLADVLTHPSHSPDMQDAHGGIVLKNGGYVDLPSLLESARRYFQELNVLSEGHFNFEQASIRTIYCDGPFATQNPYWSELPFRPVRGELIDIKCQLPTDRIVNRGVFMVPRDGIFRVGSTYDHDNLVFEPQQSGVNELQRRLKSLYTGAYELVQATAGVRPATHDRKPYIGWHPKNKAVGVFNGFGTKGVSLVPYFSKLFVDSIEGKKNLIPEVDVSRVF